MRLKQKDKQTRNMPYKLRTSSSEQDARVSNATGGLKSNTSPIVLKQPQPIPFGESAYAGCVTRYLREKLEQPEPAIASEEVLSFPNDPDHATSVSVPQTPSPDCNDTTTEAKRDKISSDGENRPIANIRAWLYELPDEEVGEVEPYEVDFDQDDEELFREAHAVRDLDETDEDLFGEARARESSRQAWMRSKMVTTTFTWSGGYQPARMER